MTNKNTAALEFLLSRRSRPAKTLKAPVPGRDDIQTLLQAAARTPDHGKLEPWRFIVLERGALNRLAGLVTTRGTELNLEDAKLEKTRRQFADADLAIAVVSSVVASPKVPWVEQVLSAGAVCLQLLNAALASGWGANWLTGWMASDRAFLTEGLELQPHEFVAGYIHIGTETMTPPERPRPDVNAKTVWKTS